MISAWLPNFTFYCKTSGENIVCTSWLIKSCHHQWDVCDGRRVVFMLFGSSVNLSDPLTTLDTPPRSSKIVCSSATNFLQSSSIYFFPPAFVPTPLRDHFLCFCSLKMPPEIMSECSKQLGLMPPYFSDKTGEGEVFPLKSSETPWRQLPILSSCGLWARVCVCESGFTRGATKPCLGRKCRRREGITLAQLTTFERVALILHCWLLKNRSVHPVRLCQASTVRSGKSFWEPLESKHSWRSRH